MLGKSNASEFIQAYPILGPLIYSSYNIIMLCFALNIFISIITDAFSELRVEEKVKPNEFDLIKHLYSILKKWFLKKSSEDKLPSSDKYKDYISIFPEHIDRIGQYLNRVCLVLF
jgi:hypothetical protein